MINEFKNEVLYTVLIIMTTVSTLCFKEVHEVNGEL